MRSLTNVSLIFLFFLFVPFGCTDSKSGQVIQVEPSVAAATNYLTFQIGTSGPNPNIEFGPMSPPQSRSAIEATIQDIINAIGETGSSTHKLGVMLGPISIDHSAAEVKQIVTDGFDLAIQYNIAVGFHTDDSMFWGSRLDLWSDADNVEWLDWSEMPSSGRVVDWVPLKLAPVMTLNSVRIINEVELFYGDILGSEIAAGVENLRLAGRDELFAGVIAGWETHLGRDYFSSQSVGFNALANRGFDVFNPPGDIDAERVDVVHEFIDLMALSLVNAGIEPDRIFAHTAFLSKENFDKVRTQNPSAFNGESYEEAMKFAPPSVAFGALHNPGFSTYPQGGSLFEQIYDELEAHNSPPWASCEGTNAILGDPPVATGYDMEAYLAKMYNHGGVLVNLFAWGAGVSGDTFNFVLADATENSTALQAYRKFLRGELLRE